jgi:predicted O-linked N-acetylglucosamine transferase (SPINDLY family)
MTSAPDLVAQALARHRAGDLDGAEALYRRALELDAASADAWHLLGVLLTNRGRPDQALEALDRALALRPGDPGFLLNRGVALQALGRLAEAEGAFRQAAEARPDLPEAHNNLANTLHKLGHEDQALQHWRRALALRPDYFEAHQNLALILGDRGDADAAVEHARAAARLAPLQAPVHLVLAGALSEQGRHAEAEAACREALRLQPKLVAAHLALARVLRLAGRADEALATARETLKRDPRDTDAHVEAGVTLACLGRPGEAELRLRHALWLRHDGYAARHNLGVLLAERRRFAAATEQFRQALRLRPGSPADTLSLARALARLGDLDGAVTAVREALVSQPGHAPLWSCLGELPAQQGHNSESVCAFREALRLKPDFVIAHSSLLIMLNTDPSLTPAQLLCEHRQWAAAHTRVEVQGPSPQHDRDLNRRLRVGYVSPDLVKHVLVHFFEPALAHHDPAQVQAVCYADVLLGDAVTARLRSLAHGWRSIHGQSDDEVASLVRQDRIDILVDLAGHTGGRLGLFARRPAPVQVSWLGYPATTGLDAMQYRLTDAVADPPGEPPGHTEELVRLPDGFCAYLPDPAAPPVSPPPCRANGFVTFASLHKLAKLNDEVLDLWCAVLRAAPRSRLLVFRDVLRGSVLEDFRQRFARRGFSENRVVLRHRVEGEGGYLAVYREVDMLLDAFPWGGHATACEALWMGVPVVTMRGDRYAGRMVASTLTQVGLVDLIAGSPEEFVGFAAALASNTDRLATLRAALREQVRRSPLCDGAASTRHLEAAYRALWRRWAESGRPPLS